MNIVFAYPPHFLHNPSTFQLQRPVFTQTDRSPVFGYTAIKRISCSIHGDELNSSNQEELIALFRRIKTSISKTETSKSFDGGLDVLQSITHPETEKELSAEKVVTQKPSSKVASAEMKLNELKELAKSRGIKGYSKLNKSLLVELLNSS